MTLLHRQKMSVYALAKHAGLPRKTVQRICKGEGKQSSVWTIVAMARVLGVSVDYLMGLTDDERPREPSRTRQFHGQEEEDVPPPPKRQRICKAAPVA
jgi:transcriptional regulator with XRE-family HTH domain